MIEDKGAKMSVALYDEIAEWYDRYISAGEQSSFYEDLVLPALAVMVSDVAGREVLDLACGQGVVARSLAKAGAAVTGVPTSAEQKATPEIYRL